MASSSSDAVSEEVEYPTFVKAWEFSDIVLVACEKKFHVHKAVISMWSPTLKCQILALGDKTELEVEGCDKLSGDDFLQLLQTIYPPNKHISELNVDKLVTLANQFNMFELLRRCEEFLIKNKTPTLILLVFAQDQNLTKLLAKCIDYCSKQSIEELKKTMNFDKIAPQNLCNLLEVRCLKMEKKLKRSEMRSWELTCTLRAIYESWNKKEGACVTHRRNGMHQENCNDCLHAIRRQIDKLCELALDNPSDQSD